MKTKQKKQFHGPRQVSNLARNNDPAQNEFVVYSILLRRISHAISKELSLLTRAFSLTKRLVPEPVRSVL